MNGGAPQGTDGLPEPYRACTGTLPRVVRGAHRTKPAIAVRINCSSKNPC